MNSLRLRITTATAVLLPLLFGSSVLADDSVKTPEGAEQIVTSLLPPEPSTIEINFTPTTLPQGFFCPGFNSLHIANPTSEILAGRVSIKDLGLYQAGLVEKPYDINWQADPYQNSTWRTWFLTLKWLGTPLSEIAAPNSGLTDQQKRERLVFVLQVTADLLIDNPKIIEALPRTPEFGSMAHRAQFLSCLAELAPGLAWLNKALLDHAQHITDNDKGDWNQGLDQHLGLLSIGQILKDDTIIQEARRRLERDAETAFDSQGVSNEQSISYGVYAYKRWQVASNRLARIGLTLPQTIQQAMKETPTWLAHATQPDATYTPLGESFVRPVEDLGAQDLEFATTQGVRGVAPAERFKVYTSGYVFGRSSWSDFKSQSYYTIRFGPRIDFHGQRDHTSITWWSQGNQILIDSGHPGYVDTVRRRQMSAIDAHNVLRPISKELSPERTTLINQLTGSNFESYTLSSNSPKTKNAPKITRTRSVLFHHDLGFVLVADKGSSSIPTTWQQRWLFAPGLNDSLNTTNAVTESAQPRVLPIRDVSLTPTRIVRSSKEVIFKALLNLAPVVDLVSQKRSSVTLVTLISYGKAVEVKNLGINLWQISIDGKQVTVRWNLSGAILEIV